MNSYRQALTVAASLVALLATAPQPASAQDPRHPAPGTNPGTAATEAATKEALEKLKRRREMEGRQGGQGGMGGQGGQGGMSGQPAAAPAATRQMPPKPPEPPAAVTTPAAPPATAKPLPPTIVNRPPTAPATAPASTAAPVARPDLADRPRRDPATRDAGPDAEPRRRRDEPRTTNTPPPPPAVQPAPAAAAPPPPPPAAKVPSPRTMTAPVPPPTTAPATTPATAPAVAPQREPRNADAPQRPRPFQDWNPNLRNRDGDQPPQAGPSGARPVQMPSAPAPTAAAGAGAAAATAPATIEQLKTQRVERVEGGAGGKRTIIEEPDKRTIVRQNNRMVIQSDETARLRRIAPGARVETNEAGATVSTIERQNGVKIVSETDRSGQLIRRYRRDASGRETDIIDNRRRHGRSRFGRNLAIGAGVGLGVVAGAAILNSVVNAPRPRVTIPRDKYIVRYEDASEDDVYEALSAPPVDRISEEYTLDQVRASPRLRDRMRRVDLDDINFEFGSWQVEPSEYRKLERVARAMMRVIDRNPNEVFLIEGYTDAVGSNVDNLTLSDRRAESVAMILSEQFQVPFENLTTQGYGEDYLKVLTQGPERANRRVAVRRITPLLSRGDVRDRSRDRDRDDDRRFDDRRDRRDDDRRYDDRNETDRRYDDRRGDPDDRMDRSERYESVRGGDAYPPYREPEPARGRD